MSQSTNIPDDLLQQLISQWPLYLLLNYLNVSALVLMLYEFSITFGVEVTEIWSKKWKPSKVLFILNRYPYFFSQICFVLGTFLRADDKSCNILSHLQASITLVFALTSTVILFQRTKAVLANHERKKLILVFLGLVATGLIATNFWAPIIISTSVAYPPPIQIGPYKCISVGAPNANAWDWANLILNIVFDLFVFLITLWTTLRAALNNKRLKVGRSLQYLLLRDGTIYYFVILFLAIAQTIFNEDSSLNSSKKAQIIVIILAGYSNVLSWLLINRLLLNLSEAWNKTSDGGISTYTVSLPSSNMAYAKNDKQESVVNPEASFLATPDSANGSDGYYSSDTHSDLTHPSAGSPGQQNSDIIEVIEV